MSLKLLDFIIRIQFFFCYRVKKWVTNFFGLYNPKISKKWARHLIFLDYIIQFGLHKPNCISINFKYVCNMDSHFMNNINLPNFHPSVLGHCYLFLVKKSGFRATWLDCFETSLENQKKKKNQGSRLHWKGTSYRTPPLKIQNSIV